MCCWGIITQAKVREKYEFTSQRITDLPEGLLVTVAEQVDRRARITRPIHGWISLKSMYGQEIATPVVPPTVSVGNNNQQTNQNNAINNIEKLNNDDRNNHIDNDGNDDNNATYGLFFCYVICGAVLMCVKMLLFFCVVCCVLRFLCMSFQKKKQKKTKKQRNTIQRGNKKTEKENIKIEKYKT